jgi:hypothetical protein
MGRTYAGILGPLAFTTVLARTLIDQNASLATLQAATCCLFVFAAIGYVAGRIADSIVGDLVRTRLNEELAARKEAVKLDGSS